MGPFAKHPLASVAFTIIGKLPDCVGVPLKTPPEESERPVGKVLVVEKTIVPIPPVCVKVWLKGTPFVPVVTTGLVTVIV